VVLGTIVLVLMIVLAISPNAHERSSKIEKKSFKTKLILKAINDHVIYWVARK
jgi:hypothetical protein